MSVRTTFVALILLPPLAGCSSQQSAFYPTGHDAEQINILFWVMTLGGATIFALVLVLAAIAILGPERVRRRIAGEGLIKWLGVAFPVVVLTVLLVYGFVLLQAGAPVNAGNTSLRIAVSGEQWWWRVTYRTADGREVDAANEIHLPVDQPVTIELTTADVIHSFWAPSIAGKLDMIPGRTNQMTVTATSPGITRGQCAEYCGGAHAFMAFHVVAQTQEEFDAWLEHEAADAQPPETDGQRRGQELFLSSGCGGCHAVRGTRASGEVGPDLTHVGGRHSLAAATLPNSAEAFADFIVNNQHIKPENRMPPYGIFSEEQLEDLAGYLEGLR